MGGYQIGYQTAGGIEGSTGEKTLGQVGAAEEMNGTRYDHVTDITTDLKIGVLKGEIKMKGTEGNLDFLIEVRCQEIKIQRGGMGTHKAMKQAFHEDQKGLLMDDMLAL